MGTEGGLHLSEWGSIPHRSTKYMILLWRNWISATPYEGEGYRFKSYQECQFIFLGLVMGTEEGLHLSEWSSILHSSTK